MDFMATKGLEYLLIFAYFILLVPFWYLLVASDRTQPGRLALAVEPGTRGWFSVPDGFHVHPGHGWARSEGDGLLTIGMDDLAHRLIGAPNGFELPPAGTRLAAGEPGWNVQVDGRSFPVLAPVSGEVVDRNEEALRDPAALADDPYRTGWLMKVRVPSAKTALKNLMPDRVARLWTEAISEDLSRRMGGELGVVLQDGGFPVAGLAREVAGEEWPALVAQVLLAEGEAASERA
jgi:glycine cleavage system H lipoate-binding protein